MRPLALQGFEGTRGIHHRHILALRACRHLGRLGRHAIGLVSHLQILLLLLESQGSVRLANLANETLYAGLLSLDRLALLVRHMSLFEPAPRRS